MALYGIQASYSADFGHALENVVFFYVPFALLFVLVARVAWTPRLARCASGCSSCSRWRSSAIGFVEYATRHLFLNPKVIASNQLQHYFRVNSLFFDPNIYGRFLVVVMLVVGGGMLRARAPRDGRGSAPLLLAVLWGGLVLTLLAVELRRAARRPRRSSAALRWGVRWALLPAAAVVRRGLVALALGSRPLRARQLEVPTSATSGRYDLIKGGG